MVALYRVDQQDPRGGRLWRFACDCGNEVTMSGVDVRRGRVKSCGCIMRGRRPASQKNSAPLAAKTERQVKSLEKALSKAEARLAKKDEELAAAKESFESFKLDNIKLRVELRNLKKQLAAPKPRRARERQPAEPWW